MASFWIMSSGMAFMTFVLTFAGAVQTHLQRVLGMNYMEVQDQLAVFYWMRFGSGVAVVLGAAVVDLFHARPRTEDGERQAKACCRRPNDQLTPAGRRGPQHQQGSRHERHATSVETSHARDIPFYRAVGNECAVFEAAFRNKLPLLIKGPTGCGKTRFVAHMAARLGAARHDFLS
jgi:hypothetical protein